MSDHPSEQEKLLIFTVSDEELEKAAGGTTCTYPGTGVATICQSTEDEARRIPAKYWEVA